MDEKLTFPQKLLRMIPLIALPLVVGAVSVMGSGTNVLLNDNYIASV